MKIWLIFHLVFSALSFGSNFAILQLCDWGFWYIFLNITKIKETENQPTFFNPFLQYNHDYNHYRDPLVRAYFIPRVSCFPLFYCFFLPLFETTV